MALTNQDYSENDFKGATAKLLPPGHYWEYEPGDDLDNLLSGLAVEFKATHDETQQNILYAADNIQSGWKLSDYQTLLDTHSMNGFVFDSRATPNLIYIDIEANDLVGEFMKSTESYRLPHTAFLWTLKQSKTLHAGAANHSVQVSRKELAANCSDLAHSQALLIGTGRQSLQVNRREIVAQYLNEYPVQYIQHDAAASIAQTRNSFIINRTELRTI